MKRLPDEYHATMRVLVAWFQRDWFHVAVFIACLAGFASQFFQGTDDPFEESPARVWWRYAVSPTGLFFHGLFLLPIALSLMSLVIVGSRETQHTLARSRRALGLWLFAAAWFGFEHMPGLVTTTHRVSGDSHEVTATYHPLLLPIVLVGVTAAALAVLPSRPKRDERESGRASFHASIATWLLILYPIQVASCFYFYVLRQRILLGVWPQPYRPDPKTAGMDIHHAAIFIAFAAVPIVALAALACIVALRPTGSGFPWRWAQACWVLTLTILIVLVLVDPGNFIEWYCD
jgi:hypothetical protein